MRMDPTDFADVTGYTYTYLLNGLTPDANWTGVFRPGEKVRLRCIAAGAMTYFDVRIPDLKMTVVQVDGQNVQPVEVDEFRIAPGETYDVIVQPDDRAYTLFVEAMDRSGYTRGTCHVAAQLTFTRSVHGTAVRRGVLHAPTCTGCHGIHTVQAAADPTAPTAAIRVAEATCAR